MQRRLEIESGVWTAKAFGLCFLLFAFVCLVTLLIQGEARAGAFGFLSLVAVGGLLLLVPPRKKRLVLDANTGAGSLEESGLFGRRTIVFRVKDVNTVRSFANSLNERVYLHLSDGRTICGYATMKKMRFGFWASEQTEAVAARIEALTKR